MKSIPQSALGGDRRWFLLHCNNTFLLKQYVSLLFSSIILSAEDMLGLSQPCSRYVAYYTSGFQDLAYKSFQIKDNTFIHALKFVI